MQRRDSILLVSLLFLSVAMIAFIGRSAFEITSTDADESIALCQTNGQDGIDSELLALNRAAREPLDFDAHIGSLRKTLPAGFTAVVEKPFIVIGDQSPEQVNQWASGTIRWTVAQIKDSYFENEPDHIINIWLFKDKDSYEHNATELFGSKPSTPYGYYSPSDKALVMNISTGGGTLVHEIVHPFMAVNFTACPSWFNEGLASLYEQSSERDGKIVGLTNWRLRGLQLAIRDDLLGSFEKMMPTSDRGFYEGDSTNYAQARYLCYWLQEHGLLREFYHAFAKNAANDPEGIKTLQQTLRSEDLSRFQQQWEAYVLKLRFR